MAVCHLLQPGSHQPPRGCLRLNHLELNKIRDPAPWSHEHVFVTSGHLAGQLTVSTPSPWTPSRGRCGQVGRRLTTGNRGQRGWGACVSGPQAWAVFTAGLPEGSLLAGTVTSGCAHWCLHSERPCPRAPHRGGHGGASPAVALAGQPQRAGPPHLWRQPHQPPVGADRCPLRLRVSPASHVWGGPGAARWETWGPGGVSGPPGPTALDYLPGQSPAGWAQHLALSSGDLLQTWAICFQTGEETFSFCVNA